MKKIKKNEDESKLTSPLAEFIKTSKKLNSPSDMKAEAEFNQRIIEEENKIRVMETLSFSKLNGMRIDGILNE